MVAQSQNHLPLLQIPVRRLAHGLVCLLVLAILCLAANAQAALPDGSGILQNPLSNAGDLRFWHQTEDEPNAWRAALKQASKLSDEKVRASVVSTTGSYWMVWKLPKTTKAQSKAGRFVQIADANADATLWYLDSRNRVLKKSEADQTATYQQRNGVNGSLVVEPPRRTRTVVVRLQAPLAMHFTPALISKQQLNAQTTLRHFSFGIFAGAITSLVLVSLALLIFLKDLTFLAMIGWTIAGSFIVMVSSGVGFEFFWADKPHWNKYAIGIGLSVFASLGALMTWLALDARSRLPAFLSTGMQVTMVLGIALAVTISMVSAKFTLLVALVAVAMMLVLSVTGILWRLVKGEFTFASMLFAALIMCAALGGHIYASFGHSLPGQLQQQWWLPLAMPIALAIYAGALVQRLYSTERLMQFAQASVITTHRAATARLEESVRARTFELEVANEQLSHVNRVDGLTGVYNRRFFDESLETAFNRARDRGLTMAVMMIDLDFFKKLNDEYGHAAGDTCLIQASQLAAACVTEDQGFVARYGGEEFVCLLNSTEAPAASAIAEHIRSQIEQAKIKNGDDIIQVTASIGVNCAMPMRNDTAAAFLEAADMALYQAKEGGRNQVVMTVSDAKADSEDKSSEPAPTEALAKQSPDLVESG